jgi:hypothetical protein
MQKSNYIFITTLAVSLMLTIPLAFGMATVTINDNFVELRESATGGLEIEAVEADFNIFISPDKIGEYPVFRFHHKDKDNNLIPSTWFMDRTVDFQVTVPQGVKFVLYAHIYKGGVANTTDITIDININGNDFSVHVTASGLYGDNEGYYSVVPTEDGPVMKKIELSALKADDFMSCNEGEAVLNISGERAGTTFAKIEFAIVFLD